ncbi:hypothetical protein ACHAXT_003764 [Thalassiosira profunda]
MKVRLPSLSPTASPGRRKKAPAAVDDGPRQPERSQPGHDTSELGAGVLALQLAVGRLARLAAEEEEARDGSETAQSSPGARDDACEEDERDASDAVDEAPIAIPKFARMAAEETSEAPLGIEEFANMVAEEEKERREARKDPPSPGSVAARHFANLERKRKDEIEAARARVWQREPMRPLPIDHFTRLAAEERDAKIHAKRKLAEAQMPEAVRHFTRTAEVYRALQRREKAGANDAPKEVARMPAAVQKFTLQARQEKAKKRAAQEEARRRMPAVLVGVAHFTQRTRAQELAGALAPAVRPEGGATVASSFC